MDIIKAKRHQKIKIYFNHDRIGSTLVARSERSIYVYDDKIIIPVGCYSWMASLTSDGNILLLSLNQGAKYILQLFTESARNIFIKIL